jgi:hypothetical protein
MCADGLDSNQAAVKHPKPVVSSSVVQAFRLMPLIKPGGPLEDPRNLAVIMTAKAGKP